MPQDINTNKTNNHKLLIAAFITVDLILIGLIALAFGGFNPNIPNQSFAVDNLALSSNAINTQIPVAVNSLITVNQTPMITGTSPTNSTVVIRTANETQTVMSDSNGVWEFTPTIAFSIGIHDIRVEALDISGQVLGIDSTMDELEIIPTEPISSSVSPSLAMASPDFFGNPDLASIVGGVTNDSLSFTSFSNSISSISRVEAQSSNLSMSSISRSSTNSTSLVSMTSSPSSTISTSKPSATSSSVIVVINKPNSSLTASLITSSSSVNITEMNTARTGGFDSLRIVSLIIFVVFNLLFIKLKNKSISSINLE